MAQPIPLVRRITQTESDYRLRCNTTALQVSSRVAGVPGAQQYLVIPQHGIFVHLAQLLFSGVAFAFFLRVSAPPLLLNRNARFLRQIVQRLPKIEPLLLLHKGEDIAALVTSKTPPRLRFREYMKRGGALVVKRAMASIRFTRFLKSNHQPYFFHHVYFCFDCLNQRCHNLYPGSTRW